MNLWSWSCSRAGRWSASIHSDNVLGSSTPWTGDISTAAARDGRSCARSRRARTRSRRDPDDELDLVVRRETAEIAPVVLRGLAAGRAFDVDDLQHLGRHARRSADGRRSRASPCGHGQQAIHQRIDVLLQQRFPAGDLDEPAAVRLDPRRPRPPTSCAPRGTRRRCRTSCSADRRRSAGRTRTAPRRASTRPGSNRRSR